MRYSPGVPQHRCLEAQALPKEENRQPLGGNSQPIPQLLPSPFEDLSTPTFHHSVTQSFIPSLQYQGPTGSCPGLPFLHIPEYPSVLGALELLVDQVGPKRHKGTLGVLGG